MNATVLQVLRDFSIADHEPIFSRRLDLGEPLSPRRGNLAKAVTGMRRSGKSYRLLQEMKVGALDVVERHGIENAPAAAFAGRRLVPASSNTARAAVRHGSTAPVAQPSVCTRLRLVVYYAKECGSISEGDGFDQQQRTELHERSRRVRRCVVVVQPNIDGSSSLP